MMSFYCFIQLTYSESPHHCQSGFPIQSLVTALERMADLPPLSEPPISQVNVSIGLVHKNKENGVGYRTSKKMPSMPISKFDNIAKTYHLIRPLTCYGAWEKKSCKILVIHHTIFPRLGIRIPTASEE